MKALFAACCVLLGLAGCLQARTPCEFVLPDGYTGWVMVLYDCPDAKPLPIENGRRVIRFDRSGLLRTSSKLEYGNALDDYRYAGGSGRVLRETIWGGGGDVWAGANGVWTDRRNREHAFLRFYIGSEDSYHANAGGAPVPGLNTPNQRMHSTPVGPE